MESEREYMPPQNFSDLEAALAKLSTQNGDIVFYDRAMVDPDVLTQIQSPSPDQDDVWFIPVHVFAGKTVADAFHKISKKELVELLK